MIEIILVIIALLIPLIIWAYKKYFVIRENFAELERTKMYLRNGNNLIEDIIYYRNQINNLQTWNIDNQFQVIGLYGGNVSEQFRAFAEMFLIYNNVDEGSVKVVSGGGNSNGSTFTFRKNGNQFYGTLNGGGGFNWNPILTSQQVEEVKNQSNAYTKEVNNQETDAIKQKIQSAVQQQLQTYVNNYISTNVQNDINQVKSDLNSQITNLQNSVNTKLSNVNPQLLTNVQNQLNTLKSSVATTSDLNQLSQTLNQQLSTLKTNMNQLNPSVTAELNTLKNTVDNAIKSQVSSQISTQINQLKSNLESEVAKVSNSPQILNGIQQQLSALKTEVSNNVSLTDINNKINDLKTYVSNTSSQQNPAIVKQINDLQNSLSTKVANMNTVINSMIEKEIQTQTADVESKFATRVTDLKANIDKQLSNLSVSPQMKAYIDNMVGTLKSSLQQRIQDVKNMQNTAHINQQFIY